MISLMPNNNAMISARVINEGERTFDEVLTECLVFQQLPNVIPVTQAVWLVWAAVERR